MPKPPENAYKASPGATLIHRQITFTLASFACLKAWQRHLEQSRRRRFTNAEVLDHVLVTARAPER